MPLRETLQRIITEFPNARKQPLEANPLARFIRGEAEQAVTDGLGAQGSGLLVQGSPGQGNWAAIPWIAVFDPAVTSSAIRGYYVVYLFHATEPVVFLSLNQGVYPAGVRFENARYSRRPRSFYKKTFVGIRLGSPNNQN